MRYSVPSSSRPRAVVTNARENSQNSGSNTDILARIGRLPVSLSQLRIDPFLLECFLLDMSEGVYDNDIAEILENRVTEVENSLLLGPYVSPVEPVEGSIRLGRILDD